MPVSTGNVVALEYMHVKASVIELAVGDKESVRNRALSDSDNDEDKRGEVHKKS